MWTRPGVPLQLNVGFQCASNNKVIAAGFFTVAITKTDITEVEVDQIFGLHIRTYPSLPSSL